MDGVLETDQGFMRILSRSKEKISSEKVKLNTHQATEKV